MSAFLLLALLACGDGGRSYRGLVTDVSEERITVTGEDGPRTFRYAPGLVPLEHLVLHEQEQLPVVVHWETRDDEPFATAIDDG